MIVISSGHGLHVAGARDIIDEVTEARRVVDRISQLWTSANIKHSVFHENITRNRNDNVNAIVRHHNSLQRDLDVSVHFNSFNAGLPVGNTVDRGMGVETLYISGDRATKALASRVSRGISNASGLILRRGDGTLGRTTEVGFLRNTNRPAILVEVCFVNSRTDVRLYQENFEAICLAIAETISGQTISGEEACDMEQRNFRINGENMQVDAILQSGSMFAAVRPLFEKLGYTVGWEQETQTVIINGNNTSVSDGLASIADEMRNLTQAIKER